MRALRLVTLLGAALVIARFIASESSFRSFRKKLYY